MGIKPNIETIYTIVTYKCNLKCAHCQLRLKSDNFNQDKFFDTIKQYKDIPMILFGGEPTLHIDRIKKICDNGNVVSISTNLINVDQQIIDIVKQYNLSIATSWNVVRFTPKQYQRWLSNLKLLSSNQIKTIVLITITEDLINYNINDLIMMFKQWTDTSAVSGILFEQLIDYSKQQQYYDCVDQWLIDVDRLWTSNIANNMIVDHVMNWSFNCSRKYTLHPDGRLTFGCPQYEKTEINSQCYYCDFVNVCQPCRLQKCCTFPKKFYRYCNEKTSI